MVGHSRAQLGDVAPTSAALNILHTKHRCLPSPVHSFHSSLLLSETTYSLPYTQLLPNSFNASPVMSDHAANFDFSSLFDDNIDQLLAPEGSPAAAFGPQDALYVPVSGMSNTESYAS